MTRRRRADLPKRSLPTSTEAVHGGAPRERARHEVALPISQTSTFSFASSEELERFFRGEAGDREEYGRYGNPTVREVEAKIAALDGAEDALLFASGMAAISTAALALLKSGDHVVVFGDAYRRTRQLVAGTLARFGVRHSIVEAASIEGLERAIEDKTRLAITESPTNPHLRCIDLERFASVCRAKKVKSMVDATFATPINARPLALGVDLVAHSATKYLAGHNDVLAGTIAGAASLVSLVRDMRGVLGGVCDPHAAHLVGRGVKTLALRVDRHNASGLAIARALEAHPNIERVFYPGLSSHPDHAVASKQMRGFGGVVSFVVKGGRAAARKVVDRFELATIAPSLGGVETLVEQPAIMSFFELDDAALAEAGVEPGLVRLAIGVEETEDVLADVLGALDDAG